MVGLLAPLIGGAVKTMCMSMRSDKLLADVVLIQLRKLVASTDNKLDDKILAAYEKQLG